MKYPSILQNFEIAEGQLDSSIVYISTSLLFMSFFGALSIDAVAFYIISCQRCFEVFGDLKLMKDLCDMMLNRKSNLMTTWEKNVCKRRVHAMPNNLG